MRYVTAVTGALLLLSTSSRADIADEVNSVSIANMTGATINFLFMSPGDSQVWGPDVLQSDAVLAFGEQAKMFVHYPDECGLFDFLAIDENGAGYLIKEVTVCDGLPATVALTQNALQGSGSDFDKMGVRLDNLTASQLDFVFVSPSDSAMIGVDMLSAGSVLPSGSSFTLVVPRESNAQSFQVIAFGNDGSRYDFPLNLDFSQFVGDTIGVPIENSDRVQ